MNVVVPYVTFNPDLCTVLREQRVAARYVDTSAPDGYWRVLRDCWAGRETFIVLEQDKIPSAGALQELWDCPRRWCTYPVAMRGTENTSPYPSLSCTKFHADLVKVWPTLVEDVGTLDLGFGEKEWSRLDMGIAGLLSTYVEPHWHEAGRVEHRH